MNIVPLPKPIPASGVLPWCLSVPQMLGYASPNKRRLLEPFNRRVTMSCSRCQGLMVREHFLDFDGTLGHMWASGYRCMNCGNVHDPVIEQHRRVRPEPVRIVSTDAFDQGEDELDSDMHSDMRQAA